MERTMTEGFVDNAKKMGDDVMKTSRNVYLVGLGTVAAAEEQVRDVFDTLLSKGKKFEKDEKRMLVRARREMQEMGEKLGDRVSKTVSGTLNRAGVPGRDEIRTLIHRVEELTEKVDALAVK